MAGVPELPFGYRIPAKVGETTEAACRLNTIFLQLFALENKMLFGFVCVTDGAKHLTCIALAKSPSMHMHGEVTTWSLPGFWHPSVAKLLQSEHSDRPLKAVLACSCS